MPRIIFIEAGGTRHAVSADCGNSLSQVAIAHGVPGILGDCGGSCNCGTCHAYLDGDAAAHLIAASAEEQAMLEGVLEPCPSSRLLCQIAVTPALDGLLVRIPRAQF